ncbi:MAG: HD domain-containing protein [Desulfitobacteriaceae bacterium]
MSSELDLEIQKIMESGMFKYLSDINSDYAERIITFINEIAPILDSINEYFPYYTRHDVVHGNSVLARMEDIIHNECLDKTSKLAFSASEVFLLICSAFSHDLGMAVFPDEKDKLFDLLSIADEDSWKTNEKLQNHLRSNHSKRGGSYIDVNQERLDIPKNLVVFLHDLMRSHNMSINQLEVDLGTRTAFDYKEVSLLQLACILCVADLLEYSDSRVIDGVIDKLRGDTSEAAKVSYRENMKHVCIGSNVAVGQDGRIIFSGSFSINDVEVLNLTHKTIDIVEDWVRQYSDIDLRSSYPRLRIKADTVIRNLRAVNMDFTRLGVRIKKENIIGLVSSNSLWSNDDGIPIKELLQNSVEACRYRRFNTHLAKNYKPKICVVFDKDNSKIIIEDNGCGMSKNVILNNFLTVGNSRSMDSTYCVQGYNSLARFGIGFWSIFTIADRAIIKTAPFDFLNNNQDINDQIEGVECEVFKEQFRDYTVFNSINKQAGTRIELLISEKISIDNIALRIHEHIICSEIPIEIKVLSNSAVERKFFLPEIPSPKTYSEMFPSKANFARQNGVKLFQWKFSKDDIQFYIMLAYRKEKDQITFLFKDRINSMLKVVNNVGHGFTSAVCGFKANISLPFLCFDIGRVGYAEINNNNPFGIIYNINRNQLMSSKEKTEYENIAADLIHTGYREFLKDNGVRKPKQIYCLNKHSRFHGGEVYDNYTENQLSVAYEKFHDLVCVKLYEVEIDKSFDKAKIHYMNIKDVLSLQANIWTCQSNLEYDGRFFLEAEKVVPVVYEYVSQQQDELINKNYVLESCIEGSMLFDNAREFVIHLLLVNIDNKTLVPSKFIKIPIQSIALNADHEWIIAKISGRWSGTIYEGSLLNRPLEANFAFLGRYRLVVRKDSLLSNDIKEMNSLGNTYELASLCNKLQEAEQGYTNESIIKYCK